MKSYLDKKKINFYLLNKKYMFEVYSNENNDNDETDDDSIENDIVYDNPTYGDKVKALDGRIFTVLKLFDEDSPYYNEEQGKDTVYFNEEEQRWYLNKVIGETITTNIEYTSTSTSNVVVELYDENGPIERKPVWSASSTPKSFGVNIYDDLFTPVGRDATVPTGKIGILAYGTKTNGITIRNKHGLDPVIVSDALSNKKIRYYLATEELNIPLARDNEHISVSSLKFDRSSKGMFIGQTDTAAYTLTPNTATNKNVVFESSNPDVVSVDNDGNIRSLSYGTSCIKVKSLDSGIEATMNVMSNPVLSEENLFNGAYIQIYYYEPKISIYDDFIVPFYISDEETSEYTNDDYSRRFILYVTIDDSVVKTFDNLLPGDQEVNIGKLSEGEHSLIFQGYDKTNNSFGMAIHKEVWAIDPESYSIKQSEIYTMTEIDLQTYSINNNNSSVLEDMENTVSGLNRLWQDKASEGIRYFKMLPGTYRINPLDRITTPLNIPSGFTIDGLDSSVCIIKRHLCEDENKGLTMMKWDNVVDSHVLNITFEADRKELMDLGKDSYGTFNGEAFNTLYLTGGRYSSIENCVIRYATGHAVINIGGSATGFMKSKYTFDTSIPSIISSDNDSVEKCIIINGEKIFNEKYLTCPMQDLVANNLNSSQYVIFGNNSGYSWIRGISQYVYINFYNEQGEWVTTIPTMQYRPVKIPVGCRYARASILSYSDDPGVRGSGIFYKEQGTHLAFKNNTGIDCRTTVYANTCARGILFEGNNYIRCGNHITPSDIDFEDGWMQCIDVTYRNNGYSEDPESRNHIIAVCSVNHVYENNKNLDLVAKDCTTGLSYRNSNNDSRFRIAYNADQYSRYNRIKDVTVGTTNIYGYEKTLSNVYPGNELREKHGRIVINGGTHYSSPSGWNHIFRGVEGSQIRNAIIRNGNGSDTYFYNCTVHPTPYIGNMYFAEKCVFKNLDDVDATCKLSFNGHDQYRMFKECRFESPTELANHNAFSTGIFEDCIFENTVTIKPGTVNNILGDIQFNNCIFQKHVTINSKQECKIQFNNCTFVEGRNDGTYPESIFINDNYPSDNEILKKISLSKTSIKLSSITPQHLLKAVPSPLNLFDYPDMFEWTSTDENVAIVRNTGYVVRVSTGTCTVRCTHKETGVYAECSVTST